MVISSLVTFPLLKSSTSASPENQNHLQGHLQNSPCQLYLRGLSQIISSAIEVFPRLNQIYRGFNCKKIDFLKSI
jgi:hypothetical protein